MNAEQAFEDLISDFSKIEDVVAGAMFGKRCIKISGKAAIALFKETIVFKLPNPHHTTAMSLDDSILWDPSGKGRPMKEWVSVSIQNQGDYQKLAAAALQYCKK